MAGGSLEKSGCGWAGFGGPPFATTGATAGGGGMGRACSGGAADGTDASGGGDNGLLFDDDIDNKYTRALAKIGIDPSHLVNDAGHA